MGTEYGLDDYKRIFAENLSRYIKARGKTVADVAADLNFPYMTVSDWSKGKKIPRMDKIEMLANYFGIKKSDLIEEHLEDAQENTPAQGEGNAFSDQFFAAYGKQDEKFSEKQIADIAKYARWVKEQEGE